MPVVIAATGYAGIVMVLAYTLSRPLPTSSNGYRHDH